MAAAVRAASVRRWRPWALCFCFGGGCVCTCSVAYVSGVCGLVWGKGPTLGHRRGRAGARPRASPSAPRRRGGRASLCDVNVNDWVGSIDSEKSLGKCVYVRHTTSPTSTNAPAPIMLLASTATHDHMGAWFIAAAAAPTAASDADRWGGASSGPSPLSLPPSAVAAPSAAAPVAPAPPSSSCSSGTVPSPFRLLLLVLEDGGGRARPTPKGLNAGERRPPPPTNDDAPLPSSASGSEAAACCWRGV